MHQLYRHFGADDLLLYVGISLSTVSRLAQHRTQSGWFHKIVKITIENFRTISEARFSEKSAIKKEKPIYNFMHNSQKKIKKETPIKIVTVDEAVTELIKPAKTQCDHPQFNLEERTWRTTSGRAGRHYLIRCQGCSKSRTVANSYVSRLKSDFFGSVELLWIYRGAELAHRYEDQDMDILLS